MKIVLDFHTDTSIFTQEEINSEVNKIARDAMTRLGNLFNAKREAKVYSSLGTVITEMRVK